MSTRPYLFFGSMVFVSALACGGVVAEGGPGGAPAGSAGANAAGSFAAGGAAGSEDAGGAAGSEDAGEPCPFPYYYCLESCDAPEAQDPPVDWCHVAYEDDCPGEMVSTRSCGYCEMWAGTDCWEPDPHMPSCEYVDGQWQLCCEGDPGCP